MSHAGMGRAIAFVMLVMVGLTGCDSRIPWVNQDSTDWGDERREPPDVDEGRKPPDILDSLFVRYTFDSGASPEADVSGNGLNGTINGAVWLDGGERGGVLRFNGSGDYMSVPTIVGDTPALTIMAWVNIASMPAYQSIYSASSFSPRGVHFHIRGSGVVETEIAGNTPVNTDSDFAFASGDLGTWIHVAVVYDSGAGAMTARHYINGALDDTDTYDDAGKPKLGAGYVGGKRGDDDDDDDDSRWFHGMMDDLRFYGRVLSDKEIAQVYQAAM